MLHEIESYLVLGSGLCNMFRSDEQGEPQTHCQNHVKSRVWVIVHAGTRQEDTGTRKHTQACTWHMLLRSLPVGPSGPLGSPGKHPVIPSGMLRISFSVLFPCSTDAAYSTLTHPGPSGPHAGGRGTSETSPGRPLATGHPVPARASRVWPCSAYNHLPTKA